MLRQEDRGNEPFAEALSLLYLTVVKKDKGGNKCEIINLDPIRTSSHSNGTPDRMVHP